MKYQKYEELCQRALSVYETGGSGLDYIDDYINNNPNLPEAYIVRGELFTEGESFQNALSDFEKAIGIDPNDAMAYFLRGNVYAKMGGDINNNKAIDNYNRAIELDAKHVGAYGSRSNIYLKLKKYQQAISDCTKAIELQSVTGEEDFVPYNNRALAYVHNFDFADVNKDELKKAIGDFSKVIELNPEYTVAYIQRGYIYLALDKPREAINNYEKYLELDPDGEYAETARADIKDLKRSI